MSASSKKVKDREAGSTKKSEQGPQYSEKLKSEALIVKEIGAKVQEIRSGPELRDIKSILTELETINSEFRQFRQAHETITRIKNIVTQQRGVEGIKSTELVTKQEKSTDTKPPKNELKGIKATAEQKKITNSQSSLSDATNDYSAVIKEVNNLVEKVTKLERCTSDIIQCLQDNDSTPKKETKSTAEKSKPTTRQQKGTKENVSLPKENEKIDSVNSENVIAFTKNLVETTKSQLEEVRRESEQQKEKLSVYKRHITDFTDMLKQDRSDIYSRATKLAKMGPADPDVCVFEQLYGEITKELKTVPEMANEVEELKKLVLKCEECMVEVITNIKEQIDGEVHQDSSQIDQKKREVNTKKDNMQKAANSRKPKEPPKDSKTTLERMKEANESNVTELKEMMKKNFENKCSLQSQLEAVFRATTNVAMTLENIQHSQKPGGLEMVKLEGEDDRVNVFNNNIHKMVNVVSHFKHNEQILGMQLEEKQKECDGLQLSRKQLEEKQKECDGLQLRLSKVAGAKLTEGNPSITNLGDPNRPMKIGEKFSELYDNEWTDLLDNLNNFKKLTEEDVIQNIYFSVQCCYSTCLSKALQQMKDAKEHFKRAAAAVLPPDEKLPELDGNKQLAELRRQTADQMIQFVLKDFTKDPEFTKCLKRYKANKNIIDNISKTEFFKKCVGLCWMMVIQDPPMFLHQDLVKGKPYDKNVYREYTSSGSKVVFTVWPALYLHEGGALLSKGVVKVE